MNRIIKVLMGWALGVMLAVPVHAGGIDNKQNLSAKYISTGSRNGATEGTDIVTYNPAGIVKFKDGLYLQVDGQYILKEYEQALGGKAYTQDEPSFLPTFFAVYKKGDWAAFGSFTTNGGGGEVKYDEGNIITKGAALGVGEMNPVDEYIMAQSLYYTYTLGGACALNDMFSFSLGARYISAAKEIDGIIDLSAPVHGHNAIKVGYEQDADGFGYVAGLNISPLDNLNIGIRYESEINLDFKTEYGSNNMLGLGILKGLGVENGRSYTRNLPALAGLGVQWDITPKLSISSSFTLYLEENVDWAGHEDKVDHNSYDLGICMDYGFTERFRASIGYMYTDVGMDPSDFQLVEQMSPPLDNHALLAGGEYRATEKLTLLSGVMLNFYVADSDSRVGYDKTNYVFALGVQYKLF